MKCLRCQAENRQGRRFCAECGTPLASTCPACGFSERVAFYAAWQEKKLRGLFLTAAGNSGNAATRVEAFIYSRGSYAYGGYPDIDELCNRPASRDPAKREAMLHRIQQLTIDRVMFAPIWNTRVLIGIGPRVADHTINLVPMSIFPSYEDMRLKDQ